MRTVYVTHKGATVRREGALLLVFADRRKVAEVPVHDLDQLVLMGNVIVTPAALDLLVEKGVDTVFLTLHGRYRGRLVHGLSGNVRLRMAQYGKLTDQTAALRVAQSVVAGKVANMRTFLMRWVRRYGPTDALRRAIAAMGAAIERCKLVGTLDEVRGCEGSASAAYFRVFGELIRADGFYFDGRNRRPPLDPVNALLSLGYTLLSNAVEAAVEVVGLDPYVGALHALEAGRPSLVCDLVEEFRAPVVDALVVSAINRGVMHVEDFEHVGEGEPVLLRREALACFVELMEQRLAAQVFYATEGRRLTYRQIIEAQARKFARYALDTKVEYEPLVVK